MCHSIPIKSPNLLFHPIFPQPFTPSLPHSPPLSKSRSPQSPNPVPPPIHRRSIYANFISPCFSILFFFEMFQICPLALPPFIFLIFLQFPSPIHSSQFYSLNLSALDEYWHRAALMALLKLKAESLLASLPPSERPIFLQCAKGEGGKTAKGLAKCVNGLIGERDRVEGARRRKEERTERKMPESTLEGLLGMLGEAMGNLMKKRGEGEEQMEIALEGANVRFGVVPGRQQRAAPRRLVHVENLRELQRFLEMRQFCHEYLAKMARKNADLFRSHLPFGLRLRFDQFAQNGIGPQILPDRPILRRISLISPRLFPLLPSGHNSSQADWLLSPRLFSLAAPNDGFLPLSHPKGGNWLDRILAISGAGRAIEKTLEKFGEEKIRLEREIFPAVLELQRREREWAKMMDSGQRREMQESGFAFLRKEQAELVFGKEKVVQGNEGLGGDLVDLKAELMFSEGAAMSKRQRHARLEKAIQTLAQMDEPNGEEKEKNGGDKVLAPFAFTNFVAEGVALESMVLSPHAFVAELMAPAALSAEILSPRAFVAAILSPNALFTRILSPGAFRTEVLSPRALSPFVLSPEAMIAEVLSPRALEPRVLSPEMGIIKVLSPVALSPRILSPEQLAVVILSPTILSPGVLSREEMVLEVMSPHILSGGSEEEGENHGGGGDGHGGGHGGGGDGHGGGHGGGGDGHGGGHGGGGDGHGGGHGGGGDGHGKAIGV